ncbi:MAG: YezD family protein [Clostridiales Family XIII bacterium]|jgi:hypothetical protein|nr:YezD family protein [Clostridiales Family XIII bacterium]
MVTRKKQNEISKRPSGAVLSEENYRLLSEYIESVRYGSVLILIQDGKIMQIEKNEKIRLRQGSGKEFEK